MRVKEVWKSRVMGLPLFGQSPNVTHPTCVFLCIDSEEEASETGEVVPCFLEASLELILSSSMCDACEFSDRDSDAGVCRSLVSVVSRPVVAS